MNSQNGEGAPISGAPSYFPNGSFPPYWFTFEAGSSEFINPLGVG
jgi:hypothetical protein